MSHTIFTPFHHKNAKRLRFFFIGTGALLWLLASIAALLPILPHLLYRLSPQTPTVLADSIAKPLSDTSPQSPPSQDTPIKLPQKNDSLPQNNQLTINKIGLKGDIHEGQDYQQLLRLGIWRVPDFGTPEDDLPIILASHRWGYLEWSNTFRRQNSFYNLPKLQTGDSVTIIWNQREYHYRITDTYTDEKIPHYNADLILYTCQIWNSPIRIFKFAHRIN